MEGSQYYLIWDDQDVSCLSVSEHREVSRKEAGPKANLFYIPNDPRSKTPPTAVRIAFVDRDVSVVRLPDRSFNYNFNDGIKHRESSDNVLIDFVESELEKRPWLSMIPISDETIASSEGDAEENLPILEEKPTDDEGISYKLGEAVKQAVENQDESDEEEDILPPGVKPAADDEPVLHDSGNENDEKLEESGPLEDRIFKSESEPETISIDTESESEPDELDITPRSLEHSGEIAVDDEAQNLKIVLVATPPSPVEFKGDETATPLSMEQRIADLERKNIESIDKIADLSDIISRQSATITELQNAARISESSLASVITKLDTTHAVLTDFIQRIKPKRATQ